MACEYGMVHVVSETGGPRGRDYCVLYNPQWAHLPHDLSKAVSLAGSLPLGPSPWAHHPRHLSLHSCPGSLGELWTMDPGEGP